MLFKVGLEVAMLLGVLRGSFSSGADVGGDGAEDVASRAAGRQRQLLRQRLLPNSGSLSGLLYAFGAFLARDGPELGSGGMESSRGLLASLGTAQAGLKAML